jgi:hypothetical protein
MSRLTAPMSISNDSSAPGHPNDQTFLQNFIINPYKKIKNIVIQDKPNSVNCTSSIASLITRKSTQQHNLSSNATDFWGDPISEKHSSHTRLFFQNINGLSTKDYSKWLSSLQWLKLNNIDITGIAEPCINTSDIRVTQSYSSKINTYGQRSYIQFSHNTNPAEYKYQPGGGQHCCVMRNGDHALYTTSMTPENGADMSDLHFG